MWDDPNDRVPSDAETVSAWLLVVVLLALPLAILVGQLLPVLSWGALVLAESLGSGRDGHAGDCHRAGAASRKLRRLAARERVGRDGADEPL